MKEHLENKILELNLPPAAGSQRGLVIIAVHGRNQGPLFMLEQLKRLGWDHYPCVLPEATDASWYPNKFMAPIEENQASLDHALQLVWIMHNNLLSLGFRSDQIVLVGFSQGACLLSQYVLSKPEKFKAVALLTGGYIGPEGIDWKFGGDLKQTPVYISTAENDEWVPPSRVRQTAQVLEELNANVLVNIFENRPHEVSNIEIETLKKFL